MMKILYNRDYREMQVKKMKQFVNFHTHTKRCGHAEGDDEQYVKAAIMAGFHELGFSEHMGYPGIDKPGERMLYKDIDEYISSINALKKEFQDQIKLYVGFEIEYYEDQLDYLKQMRTACDYMICGQHCRSVDGGGYDYLSDDEGVISYTKQVCAAMHSGLISLLAHPDYFMLGRRDFSTVCEACAHEICKTAVACDIPLELNLNGMRYGKLMYEPKEAYPYPYRAFWEIAATYPIQVLYGYDAHQPTTLLEHARIDRVEEILSGLSFTFLDTLPIK